MHKFGLVIQIMSLNFKRRAQSLKRVKKKTSGTPGRKGRPRKEPPVVISEDLCLAQETDPSPITLHITEPVLPTIAETVPLVPAEPQTEPVPVETISEKPLEEFLIEDLGLDEEEDMPQKSLIIDTGICKNFPFVFNRGSSLINGWFIYKTKHFIYLSEQMNNVH